MKRFRDENGRLTCNFKELCEATEAEGREYYVQGGTYLCMEDGREYTYIEDDGILMHFQSPDRHSLFIPFTSCGSYLPDVASNGLELIRQ